jgi:hypothetical protein
MTEHLCVVCPQLRPGDPRIYERANVCDGCRSRLRALLAELVEHYAAVRLTKPSGGGVKVSGSRTPPLPLAVDALDITMPARHTAVSDDLMPLYETVRVEVLVYRPTDPNADEYLMDKTWMSRRRRRRDERGILAYGLSGDQVGEPSIPAVLDSWATDWQSYEWSTLPVPTVPALANWLKARLEWACDVHPAVDDFAAELASLAARVRPLAPRAELKRGVPCRECDKVTLYRWPGSDYVECGSCPVLMTPDEYERWTSLIAMPAHQPWVRQVVASQRPEEAA